LICCWSEAINAMAATTALVQTRKRGQKAEKTRKRADLPKMPKPLRERVIRERPDEVQVIETARPSIRGLTKDPIVVVAKDGRRKVVGAWIDI
jgi:hypothetical protein